MGNNPNVTAKINANIGQSQISGIDTPNNEVTVAKSYPRLRVKQVQIDLQAGLFQHFRDGLVQYGISGIPAFWTNIVYL